MKEIDQAESLFFSGFVAYQQKKYERAAELFQKAYSIVPYHDLLFNVARSREQLGDQSGAIQWYRAYLATKPIDETTVIHRLKLLGGDPTAKPLEAPVEVDTTIREIAPVSLTPWITFGIGVVFSGVGTYYGLTALDEATAARDAATQSKWSAHKKAAESAALTADITYVLGASALLAGVYLWIQQDQDQGKRINGEVQAQPSAALLPPLQLGVTPEGAQVGYRWSF
jgi:tetratricopeptide (TPR) repeat protein